MEHAVYKCKRIVGKLILSDLKRELNVIKSGIKHGYRVTVCTPVHSLKQWFPLSLHGGESGLRLIDGPDVKLYTVCWCLVLVFGWAQRGVHFLLSVSNEPFSVFNHGVLISLQCFSVMMYFIS